ncbi:MAG TPA: methyltransferase domain-containing protein [bacterium]|nr:methyltransferase domain-containing protein [bacterium]HPR86988.1 methyltransferase domain-containing protein [bacterium]
MSRQHRLYFNHAAAVWPAPGAEEEILQAGLARLGIASGENVLDLGAGKGRLALALRTRVGARGAIVALDSAERMLAAAAERLQAQRALPLCCDAACIACRGRLFDKVICLGTWPHFLQPERVICEVYRVLRPGGELLIWHTCCSRELNRFHARLDGVVACDKLPPAGELAGMLTANGFEMLAAEERPHHFWVQALKPETEPL